MIESVFPRRSAFKGFKFQSLYICVCQWQILVCASYIYIAVCQYSVCMTGWVCTIVDFYLISFKLVVLFCPHHYDVNQGGVQRRPQQSLCTSPTLLKSLSGDTELVCKALPDHTGQVWQLLLVLLPPHERVCVWLDDLSKGFFLLRVTWDFSQMGLNGLFAVSPSPTLPFPDTFGWHQNMRPLPVVIDPLPRTWK